MLRVAKCRGSVLGVVYLLSSVIYYGGIAALIVVFRNLSFMSELDVSGRWFLVIGIVILLRMARLCVLMACCEERTTTLALVLGNILVAGVFFVVAFLSSISLGLRLVVAAGAVLILRSTVAKDPLNVRKRVVDHGLRQDNDAQELDGN